MGRAHFATRSSLTMGGLALRFGVSGLVLAVLAGAAAVVLTRSEPPAEQTTDSFHAAAQYLRGHPTDGPARARLDELYASICDPMSGEPEVPAGAATGLRQATDALRDISANDPDDATLRGLFGQYLLANGMNVLAVKELRAAINLHGGPNRLTVPLAYALLRADRLEELLALSIAPEGTRHEQAVLNLVHARVAEGLGRYGPAAASLRDAYDAEPRNLAVIVALGLLNIWHGDRRAAARWLGQAMEIDPDANATLRLRGEYAYATKDFAGSAAAYGKLAERAGPHRADPIAPILGYARALIYQNDLTNAATTLAHARLPDNDPKLGYFQALLAYRSGSFQHASELAEPLVNRMHDFPPLHLLLGAAALANGYPEIARHYLERYVDADPLNDEARGLLDRVAAQLEHRDIARPVDPEQLYAALGFPVPSRRETGEAQAPRP